MDWLEGAERAYEESHRSSLRVIATPCRFQWPPRLSEPLEPETALFESRLSEGREEDLRRQLCEASVCLN